MHSLSVIKFACSSSFSLGFPFTRSSSNAAFEVSSDCFETIQQKGVFFSSRGRSACSFLYTNWISPPSLPLFSFQVCQQLARSIKRTSTQVRFENVEGVNTISISLGHRSRKRNDSLKLQTINFRCKEVNLSFAKP